jgi:NADPH2:quinone reductase
MRAYVVDDGQPPGVRFTEVSDPIAAPNEAVIQVEFFSLNNGELPGSGVFDNATVPGWDTAGHVIAAAADGSGPKVGARVVGGAWGGAWAERRAVPTESLAILPDGVDADAASTLPVARITSLRALRRLGAVVGRRVMVTAASGGVGRFAVQLARIAGADVVALTSSEAKRHELREIGAGEVVTDLARISAPVYGALDFVGGSTLVDVWKHVAADGILVSIGSASGSPATFPPFATALPHKTLVAMGSGWTPAISGETIASDLAYLARLVAAGALDPHITWRGSWKQLPDAVAMLQNRKVSGKAVLQVD